jgi:hypothetical protein
MDGMRGRYLVAALLALATPAQADRVFVSGFEFCDATDPTDSSAAEQFIFGTSSATDQAVAAAVMTKYCSPVSGSDRGKTCTTNSDCGLGTCWDKPLNACAFQMTPSGAAEYSPIPFRESDDMYAHVEINVADMPVTNGSHVDLAQFADSTDQCVAGSCTTGESCATNGDCGNGCLFRAEKVDNASTYQVKAYYGTAAYRCASAENNLTSCETNADCATFTAGEAYCTQVAFATTPPLTQDRVYQLLLGQENDPNGNATVRCSITESGFARGGRIMGIAGCQVDGWACPSADGSNDCVQRCSDWTIAADPEGDDTCVNNGDCVNPATCGGGGCLISGQGVTPEADSLVLGPDTESCTGGTVPGAACVNNGDCGSGGVCGWPTGWTLYFDDVVIDTDRGGAGTASTTGMSLLRIAVMDPTSDGATTQFTDPLGGGHEPHIDDLAASTSVDGDGADGTYVRVASGATGFPKIERFVMADVATNADNNGDAVTVASTTRPGAVGWTLFTQDTDNVAASTNPIWAGGYNGTNEAFAACSTNSDCMNDIGGYTCDSGACKHFVGTQGAPGTLTVDYAPTHYVMRTNPAAGAWTGTTYDSLQASINYTRDASGETRLSAVVAEADLALTVPSRPGILPDENTDGVKTCCIAGDSTSNDLDPTIVGVLDDCENLIAYTRGSTTPLDIAQNIQEIMDGEEGTFMQGEALVGSTGAACDVLLILSGVNTLVGLAPIPRPHCDESPFNVCNTNADCTGSVCQDYETGLCRGGANHGAQCACPRNHSSAKDPNGTPMHEEIYCLGEDDYLEHGVGGSCNDCANNADCDTNIPCTTNTDCYNTCLQSTPTCESGTCQAKCVSGNCDVHAGYRQASGVCPGCDSAWNCPGCIDLDECPDGLCMAANTVATGVKDLEAIVDAVDARACESSTCDGAGNQACSNNVDCAIKLIVMMEPHGALGIPVPNNFFNIYGEHRDRTHEMMRLYRQMASDRGHGYIDLAEWFQVYGKNNSPERITTCTNNTDCVNLGLATCGSGTCDFTGKCSAGAIVETGKGKACATNSDCNACLSAYRDGIHWTEGYATSGMEMARDSLEACLENQDGFSDGRCDEDVCTGGHVGKPCENDLDCALYSCVIGTPPFDWSTSFPLFLRFEETSGNAVNSGSLGTTCNAIDNNTVPRATTNVQESVRSAAPALTTGEYFSVTNADCLADFGSETSTDKTLIARVRHTQNPGTTQYIYDDLASNAGMRMSLNSSNQLVCEVGNGSATVNSTSVATCARNTYCHVICEYDATADTVQAYVAAAASGTVSSTSAMANSAGTFTIGGTGTGNEFRGNWDEFAIINDLLSAEEKCRICSCGIRGIGVGGGCPCNSDNTALFTSANPGLRATFCGSCTLPDCDTGPP